AGKEGQGGEQAAAQATVPARRGQERRGDGAEEQPRARVEQDRERTSNRRRRGRLVRRRAIGRALRPEGVGGEPQKETTARPLQNPEHRPARRLDRETESDGGEQQAEAQES